MSSGVNPYAAPTSRGDGSAPDPTNEFIWAGYGRYAVRDVPESTDPEYTDGFSPELATTGSPDGTKLPDDIRIGKREPPVNDPNNRGYTQRRYSDFYRRISDEETIAGVGWKTHQAKRAIPVVPNWAQDPISKRPTADMSPRPYQHRRPWHIPRNIKDAVGEEAVAHFSLADHRRTFEIYGMKPQGGIGTNTFRPSVTPWDQELYVPPQPVDYTQPGIRRGFRAV
jgi:hypothetical protein